MLGAWNKSPWVLCGCGVVSVVYVRSSFLAQFQYYLSKIQPKWSRWLFSQTIPLSSGPRLLSVSFSSGSQLSRRSKEMHHPLLVSLPSLVLVSKMATENCCSRNGTPMLLIFFPVLTAFRRSFPGTIISKLMIENSVLDAGRAYLAVGCTHLPYSRSLDAGYHRLPSRYPKTREITSTRWRCPPSRLQVLKREGASFSAQYFGWRLISALFAHCFQL